MRTDHPAPANRNTVVAGVDGSATALRAVRWAAREAGRRTIPLLLVHCCPPRSEIPGDYWGLAHSDTWLHEAARAAREESLGVEVHARRELGDPTAELMGADDPLALLVIGALGGGAVDGALLGSVALAVVTHAACPVVVVRDWGTESPRVGPVLVGIDGSPRCAGAVEFAFEMAEGYRTELVVVYATYRRHAPWPRAAYRQLEDAHARYPGVGVRAEMTPERTFHALVRPSAHARLVVVGARGRGGFAGLLLGSTSQAVLHRSACPVAVVRNGTRPS